jgi:hypothetical protein
MILYGAAQKYWQKETVEAVRVAGVEVKILNLRKTREVIS